MVRPNAGEPLVGSDLLEQTARLAPADGPRVARRRLHFTKRQFSRFTAGLRLKVREGHADESNAFRRREYGTDQVEGDLMQPCLVWIVDSIDRLRVDI